MTTNPVAAARPSLPQPDATVAPAWRDEPRAPALTVSVEAVAWLLVLLAAALFRLVELNTPPFRPDEGLAARAALDFARGNPTDAWGGDLTSALTALSLRMFGDSPLTARLASALLGVGAVAALWLYRPLIGRGSALIAAVLVAISGVAVVAARTVGPEPAALPLALLLPPLAARVWLESRYNRLPLLALVTGFGLGTGALFTATGVVVIAWLAIERSWLDGRAVRPFGVARWSPRLLIVSTAALVPGLLLAVTRYGAGPDRVTLASVRAWNGPPLEASPALSWHWPLDVLVGYEPLAFALGVAGAVLVIGHWTLPFMAGGRLSLIWACVGGLLTAIWLDRDPALLLLLTVPLALLGGIATTAVVDGLRWRTLVRSGLALLPVLIGCGFVLMLLVRWAQRQQVVGGDALAAVLVLIGGMAASGVLLWLLRGSVAVALTLLAWVVLGGLTLHATANAAFTGGSEFLTGQRTMAEAAATVRDLEAAAVPGQTVHVDRRLLPALAWPLREYPLREFVQTTAGRPAVFERNGSGSAADGTRAAIPVIERWSPDEWDGLGILRWWVLRTPWGTRDLTGAIAVAE